MKTGWAAGLTVMLQQNQLGAEDNTGNKINVVLKISRTAP